MWAVGDMAEQMSPTDPSGCFRDRDLAEHRRRTASTAGTKALPQQAQAAPGLSPTRTLLTETATSCRGRRRVDHPASAGRRPRPTDGALQRNTAAASAGCFAAEAR